MTRWLIALDGRPCRTAAAVRGSAREEDAGAARAAVAGPVMIAAGIGSLPPASCHAAAGTGVSVRRDIAAVTLRAIRIVGRGVKFVMDGGGVPRRQSWRNWLSRRYRSLGYDYAPRRMRANAQRHSVDVIFQTSGCAYTRHFRGSK